MDTTAQPVQAVEEAVNEAEMKVEIYLREKGVLTLVGKVVNNEWAKMIADGLMMLFHNNGELKTAVYKPVNAEENQGSIGELPWPYCGPTCPEDYD